MASGGCIGARQVAGPVSAARERDRLVSAILHAPIEDDVAPLNDQVDELEAAWPEIRGAEHGKVDDWAATHGGGRRHQAGSIILPDRHAPRDPGALLRHRDAWGRMRWPEALSLRCGIARGYVARVERTPTLPPRSRVLTWADRHAASCTTCRDQLRRRRRRQRITTFLTWLGFALAIITTTAPI